jgi:uncharacterized protein YggE
MAYVRLIYNSRMSRRGSVVALIFVPAFLFGQLSPNAVTVNVISQAAVVPPSQVAFSVTVTAGFNKTLDQIVGALSGLGITAANLVGVSSLAAAYSTAQPQPTLAWVFRLTVPFSQQTEVTGSLTSLQNTIGQNNTGLSLSFSVTGTQAATLSSQNCNLAALVSSARTQAQSLASAAGLSAGAIVGITSAVSNSVSPACSLTVSFWLGSASFQPTVNTITINASQTNALPLDQVTMVLDVASGLTASLDDVTGALQGAGIAGANFSGVNVVPYVSNGPAGSSSLNWAFTLVVPLSKLNSTLTQLAGALQTIQQQSLGLSLTFSVLGLSSSQAPQPPSCPDTTLMAEAQTQAQQVATAAALSLGPIQAMSGSQNLSGSLAAEVIEGGSLFATTTSTSVPSITGEVLSSPGFVCSISVQYQLLY